MKIVTWMSVLTEHQAHTFGYLGALSGEPVEYVLGTRALVERQVQGWTEMDLSGLSIHDLPRNGWWQFGKKLITQFPGAVHVFNGMWGDRRFFPLLVYAQRLGIRTCLITEPYAESAVSYFSKQLGFLDKFKSAARPWVYKLAGALVVRRMTAVFAISVKALKQFEAVGFSQVKIFPFGYFVPAMVNQLDVARPKVTSGGLRLVFVGSLIERKGLSTLVEAVELCNESGRNVSLDVYGPGASGAMQTPDALISCRGSIPFGEAQRVIRKYDALVVPSLHDGWSVVVNEALLQGVPVICSDAVGAGVLVQKSGAGSIFPVADASALALVITELIRDPDRLVVWHSKANGMGDWLSPAVAAKYQMDCLQFALGQSDLRPVAPWYP